MNGNNGTPFPIQDKYNRLFNGKNIIKVKVKGKNHSKIIYHDIKNPKCIS